MTKRRKIVVYSLVVCLLLFIGVQLGWHLRGPPRGTKQMLDLLATLRPKVATEGDWGAVAIKKTTADVSGLPIQVVAATNLRPVLEAEGDTNSRHLVVQNHRNADSITTLVWSPKANNALVLDWKAPHVARRARPAEQPEFYLQPEDAPNRVKYTGQYLIGTPGGTSEMCVKTPLGIRRFPWDRPTFIGDAYFFENYRYGVGLERNTTSHKFESMAIIDLEKLEVAGFVPLPPQVGRYGPLLIIDPNTDLLLCFDLDVAWIVCVDLRPARLAAEAADKKLDTPAPEKAP